MAFDSQKQSATMTTVGLYRHLAGMSTPDLDGADAMADQAIHVLVHEEPALRAALDTDAELARLTSVTAATIFRVIDRAFVGGTRASAEHAGATVLMLTRRLALIAALQGARVGRDG